MHTLKSMLWTTLGGIALVAFFVVLSAAYTFFERFSPDIGGPRFLP